MMPFYDLGEGQKIPLSIRYNKRAKSIKMALSASRSLRITSPHTISEQEIFSLLSEQHHWIKRALNRMPEAVPAVAFPDTVEFLGIGQTWSVHYQPNLLISHIKLRIDSAHRQLTLSGQTQDEHLVQDALIKFCKHVAKEVLTTKTRELAEKMQISVNKISVRNQRARWGSCSSKANISLNCKLLFLSPQMMNYVIIHELCHTHHLNHSAKFWALVARFEPNYRALDRALNQYHTSIPSWCQF
ncbi:MAG: M48 family metallopeptidase [Methylococcales bacterium]|mgnify:CR=1 FL=1|jgi:predicted metal-dependent hydrolase|nr:M48 family metallopeptidase [Methylococcales bacterium]MBT7445368.1 M48 family metallopeptidase [Methylococcales bacterium]